MSTYCSTSPTQGPITRSLLDWHDEPGQEPASTSSDLEGRAFLQGESLAVRRLRSQIQRIAPYYRTALVRGEPGTGKRLVARALHDLSPSAEGPFIACSALALAEAIATEAPAGESASLLESARGGTLLLECAGEVPYPLQAGLMRFLSSRESLQGALRPVSLRFGTMPQQIRILASAQRDLRTLSSIGQFRPDLYARLAAVEIVAPALRERLDDIPRLVHCILARIAGTSRLPCKTLSPAAQAELAMRPWHGNLAELEQSITHAAALAEGLAIEVHHLPPPLESTRAAAPARQAQAHTEADRSCRLHDVVQGHVLDVLTRCGGNKLRAAELLGISRSTLYRMLDAGGAVEAPARS